MKAILLTEQLNEINKKNFSSVDVPIPSFNKERECLVKIKAAGVNPSDVGGALGYFSYAKLPRIPGRDYAGIVVDGPKQYLNKKVWGSGGDIGLTKNGTHAEYIAVPINAISEKPDNLSMEEASGVGVPYITAYYSLINRCHLSEKDTVVVLAAGGQVGRAAISIALSKGARCIGITRDLNKIIKISGCEYIDYKGETLDNKIQQLTRGKGADIILNSLGNQYLGFLINALSNEGSIVTIAATPGTREFNLNLFENYRANINLVGVNTGKINQVACSFILSSLTQLFIDKKLMPPSVNEETTFPLNKAYAAYNLVKAGLGGDRIVLSMR